MKKPFVSFVMPVRNCSAFLAETIRSLLKQTLKNIEIIIFDDCSTDSSWDIIKYYRDKDKRIRAYEVSQHKGAAFCRNEGNRYAQADIICVTDAGDLYRREKAKVVHEYFKKHDIDIFYHSVLNLDQFRRPHRVQMALPPNFKEYPRGISHPTVAYRKEVILKYPYREGNIHTDQYEVMLIQLYRAGYKFGYTRKILLDKVDLSHSPSFRDIKEASKQKIKNYKEFGIPVSDWLKDRARI